MVFAEEGWDCLKVTCETAWFLQHHIPTPGRNTVTLPLLEDGLSIVYLIQE